MALFTKLKNVTSAALTGLLFISCQQNQLANTPIQPIVTASADPQTSPLHNDRSSFVPANDLGFKTLALSCGKTVVAQAYDIDDQGWVTVNDSQTFNFNYGQALQSVELTTHLNDGLNTLTYSLYNDRGGYAYGFRLLVDGVVVYEDHKLANGWGGTPDYTTGMVYIYKENYEFCPGPTPTATPTPHGTPTPSPIPTLLPPGQELNCPPQISNEVERLTRELEQIQAAIPGAPTLENSSQGFSVKAAPLTYPVATGLFYLGTHYPRILQFVQGALRATLTNLATKTSELDQARAKKAAKDAEFAEAVKNGDTASFKRLRAESNALQKEILGLEAEQRQLEQAKHNHEQNLQKLDQLGQNIAGAQASAQDNCNTPTPSPSPSNNPSPSPTAPNWIPEAAVQKIPKEWGAGIPTRKGEGWRWTDPTNKGNIVRIDKGNPLNSQPTQQIDHVIINADGRILGKDGMPINGSIKSDPINTHIPLNEWINWARWNKP